MSVLLVVPLALAHGLIFVGLGRLQAQAPVCGRAGLRCGRPIGRPERNRSGARSCGKAQHYETREKPHESPVCRHRRQLQNTTTFAKRGSTKDRRLCEKGAR